MKVTAEFDRRSVLRGLTSLVGGFSASGAIPIHALGQQASSGLYLEKQQQAVDKAIAWLASRVQPDGSFGQTAYQQNLAVVSLGGLAFLGLGNLHFLFRFFHFPVHSCP